MFSCSWDKSYFLYKKFPWKSLKDFIFDEIFSWVLHEWRKSKPHLVNSFILKRGSLKISMLTHLRAKIAFGGTCVSNGHPWVLFCVWFSTCYWFVLGSSYYLNSIGVLKWCLFESSFQMFHFLISIVYHYMYAQFLLKKSLMNPSSGRNMQHFFNYNEHKGKKNNVRFFF